MRISTKNVTKAEFDKIERMVRRCMRLLRRKEYELNLPSTAANAAISTLQVVKNNRSRSRAGSSLIRINLYCWQHGNVFFNEYAAYNSDPTIGRIACTDANDHLWVVVAHEVAHHVQYRHAPRVERFRAIYRKPHGDCFKAIYRYLRKDLINPMIAARWDSRT